MTEPADLAEGDGDGDGRVTASTRVDGSLAVGAGIFLSRVSGLVRERALGHFLGTSAAADAFTAAIRIPNLLQHLLGEGVLSSSFIPVYSRLLEEGREAEAGRVAGAVAGLLALVTGALGLLGVLAARPLTTVIAAGLRARPETFDLTVQLVQLLFPAVGLLVMSAWSLGVLNSHRRFFLSYVAPVLLNIAQIAVLVGGGIWLAGGLDGGMLDAAARERLAVWLSGGTIVGAALQLAVQLPSVLRVADPLRISLRLDLDGVRSTLTRLGPVVGARGVVQLSAYAQVFLASYLAAGALSVLRYAQILYLLPVSLFGMSVAAAELPELSRAGRDRAHQMATRLQNGLARVAGLVLPTVIGYVLLGDVIVAALFQTGAFGSIEIVAVWAVLGAYALGILASTSSRLLQSALYGIGDTASPARASILRVGVAIGLGVALMLQGDRFEVSAAGIALVGSLPAASPLPAVVRDAGGGTLRLGAVGLALGSAVGAWVEYLVLRHRTRRQIGATRLGGGQLGRIALAAAGAALVGVAVRSITTGLHPVPRGVLVIGAVAVVHLLLATRLGVDELAGLVAAVRRRLR